MAKSFTRVVKVGGSHFEVPNFGQYLARWLEAQPPTRHVLLAGGGTLVNEIRRWHNAKPLDDQVAHKMCIEAMNITAQLLVQAIPGAKLVEQYNELELIPSHDLLVAFAPLDWLRREEPDQLGTKLPESWDVTSDSIAARLAICLGADELVLLTSADPPTGDLQELSDLGYIDKFFPKLAAELPPWRMVNLRRDSCHSDGSSTT
jgi:aspartokinase-like uncharacterized kinase